MKSKFFFKFLVFFYYNYFIIFIIHRFLMYVLHYHDILNFKTIKLILFELINDKKSYNCTLVN